MTVIELIGKLNQCDSNAEVLVEAEGEFLGIEDAFSTNDDKTVIIR